MPYSERPAELERPIICFFIASPAAHRIHHVRSPQYYGRNDGILTLWEVLFRTYHPPVGKNSLTIGLDESESFNTDRPVLELVGVLTRWMTGLLTRPAADAR